MTIQCRPLQGKDDAMRLRQFLIDTYTLMGREFNWETRRWEGSYWCVSDATLADPAWGANTILWETAEGMIVGAVIPDGPGDLALQIHPDYRALEDEILKWAEAHMAVAAEDGRCRLIAWAFDWDTEREKRLQRRGYVQSPNQCFKHRRRSVNDPVSDASVVEGYIIRSVQPTSADVERWVACTNATFNQAYAPEYHRNFQVYSPSHNYDLHIIAEARDGTFAAFAGLTVEVVNRYATFEPVGTHPDHRRKGLARAVMVEGLRRLQALGTADVVYVANWGTADAGQLYAAVGLQHYATFTVWEKTW
ncbi:MAG: GNAT family N-acetyltransferase [Anaerolineae bacterium]|nr:GNAT family N-acetyltransferase [Anaerolineae bacterium]